MEQTSISVQALTAGSKNGLFTALPFASLDPIELLFFISAELLNIFIVPLIHINLPAGLVRAVISALLQDYPGQSYLRFLFYLRSSVSSMIVIVRSKIYLPPIHSFQSSFFPLSLLSV